jgi:anthranilate phosphoribosyltransferase
MRYPPRFAHLLTDAVLISRLAPSYAEAHQVDDEEARLTLTTALRSELRDDLLASTWTAIRTRAPKFKEETSLDKVATSLGDRPTRPGRVKQGNAAWSAFWIVVGLNAGTASDSARSALESEAGQAKVREGMVEVGRFLADELARS